MEPALRRSSTLSTEYSPPRLILLAALPKAAPALHTAKFGRLGEKPRTTAAHLDSGIRNGYGGTAASAASNHPQGSL
jgi:hypothetical protein